MATTKKDPERFSKDQAKATGKSERSVRRAAKRGTDLGDATLKRISGTSLDKGEEMEAKSRLPDDR